MTREQAKQNLISIGIEEPTDEQVSSYLNQLNGESKKEKDRAEKYKADADKMVELQKQLDELNNQNLSDIEKANKERDDALNSISQLQAQIKQMELKNSFAEKGIVGENADKLLESIANGGADVSSILDTIISERVSQAEANVRKELLNGTPKPSGKSAKSEDTRSQAEKIAEGLFANKSESKQDILANYL